MKSSKLDLSNPHWILFEMAEDTAMRWRQQHGHPPYIQPVEIHVSQEFFDLRRRVLSMPFESFEKYFGPPMLSGMKLKVDKSLKGISCMIKKKTRFKSWKL